jgi:nitric oxide dioxygenase
MNTEDARLIRDGWAQLSPRADEVGQAFYERLFALVPETREMFAAVDLATQRQKFLDMMTILVRLANDPADVVAETISLAQRHVRYGVDESHLNAGREALVATLEVALGDRFTPEVRQAWTHFYDLAAAVMRRARERFSLTSQ